MRPAMRRNGLSVPSLLAVQEITRSPLRTARTKQVNDSIIITREQTHSRCTGAPSPGLSRERQTRREPSLCICNEGDNTMTNPSGYTRLLYLLPFDHRASYISGLFGWKEPLDGEQMVTVANSKRVIYAGFEQAI